MIITAAPFFSLYSKNLETTPAEASFRSSPEETSSAGQPSVRPRRPYSPTSWLITSDKYFSGDSEIYIYISSIRGGLRTAPGWLARGAWASGSIVYGGAAQLRAAARQYWIARCHVARPPRRSTPLTRLVCATRGRPSDRLTGECLQSLGRRWKLLPANLEYSVFGLVGESFSCLAVGDTIRGKFMKNNQNRWKMRKVFALSLIIDYYYYYWRSLLFPLTVHTVTITV